MKALCLSKPPGRRLLRFVSSAAVCFAFAGLATAALPIGQAPLHLQFVDYMTKGPISDVYASAVETYYWTGFHSSGTTCFRSVARHLAAASGRDSIVLPSVDPAASLKVNDNRHIEIMAWRSGYCAAKPYEGAAMAGFVKWANKEDPRGLWGSVKSPEPNDAIKVDMLPTLDPAERRLRHLVLVANMFRHLCSGEDTAYLKPVADAMSREAASIAKTTLERLLAERVSDAFTKNGSRREIHRPLVNFAESGNLEMMRDRIDWAKTDPMFKQPYCKGVGDFRRCVTVSPYPNEFQVEPFQIDDRNEAGFSALMAAAKAMSPDAVKLLLQNGANINMTDVPGGYSALDLVLARARTDVRETGTVGQEIHMLRMIDLLVAQTPAPTLHPRYHEELADAAKWSLTPHLASFWSQVRDRVAKLQPRAKLVQSCPVQEPVKPTLSLRPEK